MHLSVKTTTVTATTWLVLGLLVLGRRVQAAALAKTLLANESNKIRNQSPYKVLLMKRTTMTVAVLGALLALVVSCTPASSEVTLSDDDDKLFVTGIGIKTYEPDAATMRMGVEAFANDVSIAMATAARSMDAMIAALKEGGIDEDNIATSGFRINEKRQVSGQTAGFNVWNGITVTVQDLTSLGELIDSAMSAGGDQSRFNHIEFVREDQTGSESELRAAAFEDARESAAHYAELAGAELGRLVTLSEECEGRRVSREYGTEVVQVMSEASEVVTPILVAGELELVHCVTAVFRLE